MRDFVEVSIFGRFHFGEFKQTHLSYILLTTSPKDMDDFYQWYKSKEIFPIISGKVLMPYNDGEEFVLKDVRCMHVGNLEVTIVFKSIECV